MNLLGGKRVRLDSGTYCDTWGCNVNQESNTTIDFCPDGSFAYHYLNYVSTDAGILESKTDRQGQWSIWMEFIGPSVKLSATDGSEMSYWLGTDGTSLAIDGRIPPQGAVTGCPG